jgi:hypothetical protein
MHFYIDTLENIPMSSCRLSAIALAIALTGSSLLSAQTVSVSGTAPAINGADIANLPAAGTFDAGGDQGHIWSNRPLQGQSLTTLNNPLGYLLNSVTLQNFNNNVANNASGFTVRVGTVTGNAFAPTTTQFANNSVSYAPGNYMTFNFAAPVILQPHTRYGFDWDATGSGFVTTNSNDANYLGGEAFSNGSNGNPGATLLGRGVDRVFHADLTRVTGTFHVGGENTVGTWVESTTVQNAVLANGATGRFLRLSERQGTDSRFHISELEAFGIGVAPNNAGPASVNGPNLSTNDLGAVGFHAATTTSSLEHGNPNSVFNGAHESGGAVWSTANNQMDPQPRYTLDLGANVGVETVRAFARNDTCCTSRFANLRVELFADDGGGNPGQLIASSDGPNNALGAGADQGGTNAAWVTTLQRTTSADLVATLYNDITYALELDGLNNTSDQIALVNPDSSIYTTVLELNGATIELNLLSDVQDGDLFQILAANEFSGPVNLVLPELDGPLVFNTDNLLIDGTIGVQAIPEPLSIAAWLISAAALTVAVAVRRRTRRV